VIASLPMYDLPVLRGPTDDWWRGLAHHLRAAGLSDVPAELTRSQASAWLDDELLLSQTCGYPLTHALAGRVHLVCTPAYAAPGCSGAHYSSAIVVGEAPAGDRLADFRGCVCAYNAADSHSGVNVLRFMLAPLAGNGPFFADTVRTGSHAASIDAVARGEADLCAVDAVTHALLAHHQPEALVGTRVLAYSPQAPGLPLITALGTSAAVRTRLRDGIHAALADPDLESTRSALLLTGAEDCSARDYEAILDMERDAIARGYGELR